MMPASPTPSSPSSSPKDELWASDEVRSSLLRFVLSRVRDPHVAEDLTQEILLKAFEKINHLKDPQRRRPWLYQIARNTIADYFRGAQKSATFLDDGTADDSLASLVHADGKNYFPEILSAFLREVVDGLPPIYRDALCFTDCQGHSQVELAKNAGISVSGAKSRVQRARAAVRDAVERCCLLETDRYGGVVEVEPRPGYCA
ncbi:sigma-70 family RNA polymerase sigma factor [Verrucomicrobiaceae bacterium R5-34]|nr:sigma-70 family RNA polymerase sigma factor [Verrucomicrobiaceae bacterium R5-34]